MSDTQLTTLQITYDDKVDINDQSSYQVNQLWTAEDANQVKNVVNTLATFYDLNLTSDGWKFNFVSTTDRASSISADTNTLQYVSSNSADSDKNINYSGNVLFYASVSAISQMVPNSSGSYDPQPFIATNPEHIATKAYVDGKIKTYEATITEIISTEKVGTTMMLVHFNVDNLISNKVISIAVKGDNTERPRTYSTLQINTNLEIYVFVLNYYYDPENTGGFVLNAKVLLTYLD